MRGLYDATTLERSPGVLEVHQTGPRTFQLIVDDAGTATPEAIQAMSAAGGELESVREVRPTFEDVFATLVERDRDRPREAAGERGAEPATGPGADPATEPGGNAENAA